MDYDHLKRRSEGDELADKVFAIMAKKSQKVVDRLNEQMERNEARKKEEMAPKVKFQRAIHKVVQKTNYDNPHNFGDVVRAAGWSSGCPEDHAHFLGEILKIIEDAKDGADTTEAAEICSQFLDQIYAVPDWVDVDKLERGRKFALRNALAIILTLLTASLPLTFAAKNGVWVLRYSTLHFYPARRTSETAVFVDLLFSDPMSILPKTGRGFEVVLHTRFLHAQMRYRLSHSNVWQSEWGTPLCQEDLFFALASFSWMIIYSLKKMGVHVDRDDAECYFHFWRYVGYLIGIKEEYLTNSLEEMEEVFLQKLGPREFHPHQYNTELYHKWLQDMQAIKICPQQLVQQYGVKLLDFHDLANRMTMRVKKHSNFWWLLEFLLTNACFRIPSLVERLIPFNIHYRLKEWLGVKILNLVTRFALWRSKQLFHLKSSCHR